MQTIDATFAAHALPGYNKDIYDPLSNLIAGERYALADYKSLTNVPGVASTAAGQKYKGYETGSQYIDRDQIAQLHRGEMVVRAADASTRRMMQNSSSNAPLVNVEKGAVVFNLTPTAGSTAQNASSLPAQQEMEKAADVIWRLIERKMALAKVASD
jgi:SLT domain-containing protein